MRLNTSQCANFARLVYFIRSNIYFHRENVNISSQLAQLTEKATNLTSENDKLTVKEQHSKTQISLLETEIEKLSRRNAYRYMANLGLHFAYL